MKRTFGEKSIELTRADITTLEADAIVNAANAALGGGGGVDGAIHRAGGPAIMQECRRIGACPTGSAVITGAGALHARYVIHAVAPVYRGDPTDPVALRGAYEASLALGKRHGCSHLAFPSLGTGAYGYPVAQAAAIALRAASEHLRGETPIVKITFALFSERDLATYGAALDALAR